MTKWGKVYEIKSITIPDTYDIRYKMRVFLAATPLTRYTTTPIVAKTGPVSAQTAHPSRCP